MNQLSEAINRLESSASAVLQYARAEIDALQAKVSALTAENAELRREISEHVLRADSLRAEIDRLEEELELDRRDAVSEAVERIVEALRGEIIPDNQIVMASHNDAMAFQEQNSATRHAIALLRSRDWSKGEG